MADFNEWSAYPSSDITTELNLTVKMTTAKPVKTSVIVSNSHIQGYNDLNDHILPSNVRHDSRFQTTSSVFFLSQLIFFFFEALSSRQPEENPWLTRDRVTTAESESNAASMALITEKGKALAFPEDTDDNSKCIICMEQPKNATIIHGDTGHCCCCLQCAQVLKLRGDPCPICRAPIDHVIRQFNA